MNVDDRAETEAEERYLPEPGERRHGMALCLSGGGYRAALFHLGVLRRLNELGTLGRIDTISARSRAARSSQRFSRSVCGRGPTRAASSFRARAPCSRTTVWMPDQAVQATACEPGSRRQEHPRPLTWEPRGDPARRRLWAGPAPAARRCPGEGRQLSPRDGWCRSPTAPRGPLSRAALPDCHTLLPRHDVGLCLLGAVARVGIERTVAPRDAYRHALRLVDRQRFDDRFSRPGPRMPSGA